jgi:N,N-dimethylformamidase beta subunit-like, C-terminal
VLRIIDDAGGELIGYVDRWSAQAGQIVRLMVSTTAAEVEVGLVRLRHGDPDPAGPGFRAAPVASAVAGTYPGRVQAIRSGSYAVLDDAEPASAHAVWAWPTCPDAGREQVLLQRGDVALLLGADGHAAARRGEAEVRGPRLRRERWVRLEVEVGGEGLTLRCDGEAATVAAAGGPSDGPIHLAADRDGGRCFDGKLEAPSAGRRQFDLRGARLVNAPTLAVTGRHWDDDTTDFRAAPDEYAAVHFHSDDLEDAGWEPCCALEIPANLESGAYAFELRAGELTDHVPFVVRPPTGTRRADVALLLPTLTYQVYGNERLIAAGDEGMAPAPLHEVHLDPADHWLAAHPEAGASCYDVHPGGHGVSLVSMLRPIPSLRPSFTWWINDSPERFAADLYLVDWLEEQGVTFDVITDHDLHAEGLGLIAGYDVVLTGTHPEYSTRTMLEALEQFVRDEGGGLMYLGGNGFYWVTSIDPVRPYLAELRRGVNGTRAWSSRPGELRHQTTGEQGGLWRYRGRDPNRLVGVGFAAQCDTPDRAPGYRRTAASREPEHAWIFAGVEADVIGDYGLFVGGAAGYEVDRHDPAHGSPAEAVVLATSAGMHPPSYLLVVEDLEVTAAEVTGPTTDRVRADLTWLPYPGGGAVFSTGSISWCGSLSHDGYANDVSRITGNVLRRFIGQR